MINSFALTGGIACGKSLLEKFLIELGCSVLDADNVVRLLQAPGGKAFDKIVKNFGNRILNSDEKTIDRRKLADLVFADEAKRRDLESILHPLVREYFMAWRLKESRDNLILVGSIPLLYETKWEKDWSYVVCIAAEEKKQIERMMKFRGMSERDAVLRLQAQMPVKDKAEKANYVIWNNGDEPAAIKDAAEKLLIFLRKS